MRKALVGLVVCSIASVSMGAMTMDVTKNTSPGAGLDSYTISFNGTTSGDELAAFAGSIKGSLHQVWGYSFGTWLKSIYGDALIADARDTRILLTDAKIVSVLDPDEDNPATVDEGAGVFSGFGTYYANTPTTDMIFILLTADRSLNLDLFRVVVPTGGQFTITGVAGAADEIQELEIEETIPEPATLGLLVIGAAGALIRRRR